MRVTRQKQVVKRCKLEKETECKRMKEMKKKGVRKERKQEKGEVNKRTEESVMGDY